MAESKRKLAAILSADVVGYSRLMQDDEAATVDTLTKCRSVFSDLVTRHDGRVVDSPGDNLLCEFDSPVEAVQCAVEVQRELGRRNRQLAEHRQMHFRIGINLGDVITRDDGTIYGDGVNVAARLEALAEPGGIMISESAHMQVHSLIDVGIADAGEHEVKNMARPVRAFQIVLDGLPPVEIPRRSSSSLRRPAMAAALVLALTIGGTVIWFAGLGEKATTEDSTAGDDVYAVPAGPSIAVLPFTNHSDDPEQKYFADGLTEELITALSRFQDLKTIGRHSTMQYKEKAVDIREVRRDLGVDFVVEGSVRRDPNTLRITAQLIDTRDGSHLWAETYDSVATVENLFSIQEDVTTRIVATIADSYGVISRRMATESQARAPQNWEAHQCVLLYFEYQESITEETIRSAIECAERATTGDPGYADGWGMLAELYADASSFAWDVGPDLLEQALAAGLKAVQADPFSQQAHWGLAYAYFHRRERELFKAEAHEALELNPNRPYIVAYLGLLLWHVGEWDEGLAMIEKGNELNPHGPGWLQFPIVWNHYRLGDYESALLAAHELKMPGYYFVPMAYASILGQLGRTEEAKAALSDAISLEPDLENIIRETLTPWFFFQPELLERILDGLGKAGLDIPDVPTADQ